MLNNSVTFKLSARVTGMSRNNWVGIRIMALTSPPFQPIITLYQDNASGWRGVRGEAKLITRLIQKIFKKLTVLQSFDMLLTSICRANRITLMNDVNIKIEEITGGNLENNVEIIRRSFQTIADELGLTRENCSVYPAFTTPEKLKELRTRDAVFFGLFVDGHQAGFVAVEKEKDGKYYMKRLAVLPEYRHGGAGRKLIDFVIDYVKNAGIRTLSIAIVNEQSVLKDWYKDMGFNEISIKEFEHLPFTVCFMEMNI
jgi:ribosomal protein S18 acetylase RimI-like enzyme